MSRTFIVTASMSLVLFLAAGSAYAEGSAGNGSQDRIQDPSTHTEDTVSQTKDQTRDQIKDQDQDQDRVHMSASTSSSTSTNEGDGYQNQEQTQTRIVIEPEHVKAYARSGTELGQMIQERERELAQEEASTSEQHRDVVQNANQVRLAVSALLSAQNLLGSEFGKQVAQIATRLDESTQTTANAQVKIQSRGFWTRLFFGGDATTAKEIAQNVEQNRAQIQTLTQLLSQASTTEEVKTQLQAQIATMQQEQDRLQQLADKEQRLWGIFSWRF